MKKTQAAIVVDLTGGDQEKIWERMKAVIKFARHYGNPIHVLYEKHNMDCVQFAKFLHLLQSKKLTPRVNIASVKNMQEAIGRFCELQDAVFVSAGDTREIVKGSALNRMSINPRYRPILVNTYPIANGHVLYGDLGANTKKNDRNPLWTALILDQMSVYMYNKSFIGLQNIGEENGKGGPEKEKARLLLEEYFGDKFAGNIEMHNLSKSQITCLVTEGYEGNNTIKTFAGTINDLYKKTKSGPLSGLTKMAFKLLYAVCWQEMDWRRYSGAYLMGVKKPMLLTHGRCDKFGFYSALARSANPDLKDIYEVVNKNKIITEFR